MRSGYEGYWRIGFFLGFSSMTIATQIFDCQQDNVRVVLKSDQSVDMTVQQNDLLAPQTKFFPDSYQGEDFLLLNDKMNTITAAQANTNSVHVLNIPRSMLGKNGITQIKFQNRDYDDSDYQPSEYLYQDKGPLENGYVESSGTFTALCRSQIVNK